MTLGGLALAVGILVDDATVTIENINWHLEQGKPVEPAILDGAQPDRDAGVRLAALHLHRVRADVLPAGVARYLFVPLAEAVVFAMIWSFILSRTLVPTMAKYLLQPHVASRRRRAAAARAIRWCCSSAASRRASSAFARGYRDLLALALARRPAVRHRLPGLRRGVVRCWCRSSAATSSRRSTPARSCCMCAPRSARASRRPPPVRRRRRRRSARSFRRTRSRRIVDNIGLPISGINLTYNNTGAIGPQTATS